MQLVLTDISVVDGGKGLPMDITIEEGHINQCLSVYKQGHHNLTVEERAKKDLVSEIMKTKDDIGGSIGIKIIRSRRGSHEISVTPSFPETSIFKCLVQKFQKKVKISVFLKWHARTEMIDFISLEGMTIDPKMFTCVGETTRSLTIMLYPPTKMHVKLVTDIDIPKASFAQKALENGVHSDLIISVANGTEIKAHRLFLCISSPVLEAMLKSGMEEAQTGRVDMSDLSEEGVRAFLRYIYYGDLEEPKDNIQVAYELFYASHKYDVPCLEEEMRMLLLETTNEDIGVELAFKIFMFTRTIETAVELKTKALEILRSNDSHRDGVPSLESKIELFLDETNFENLYVAVAFKIYMFTRNNESALELKRKALRVLKAKWDEMELLQEYKELFEKPSNSKTAMQICKDLAMVAST